MRLGREGLVWSLDCAVGEGLALTEHGVVVQRLSRHRCHHRLRELVNAVRWRVCCGVEPGVVMSLERHVDVICAISYGCFEFRITLLHLRLPLRLTLNAVLALRWEHVLLPEYVRHRFRLKGCNLRVPILGRPFLVFIAHFLCEGYVGHLRDLGHWLRILLRRGTCFVEL